MKKKILFLSAWYPTRYDPMLGLFVKRHAQVLTDTFDIAVLHTSSIASHKQFYEIETVVEDKLFTVRVFYRKVETCIPVLNQLLKALRLLKAHQKGFTEIRKHFGLPHLVHVNILTRMGLYALYLKIRYSIPYVITEHWSRYLPERSEYGGFMRKIVTCLVVQKSSGISTVSERLRMAMKDCGIKHSNFPIVNNVVDCNLFKPIVQTTSEKKIFSHITCFDNKAKNEFGIVRSVYALSKLRHDFVCFMVGDGADKNQTMVLAEKLGILDEYIVFTGLKEGEELVRIYNQSVFTLLFSNFENMPVVIPESFACGKPVLTSNVGGISEIVDASTGILVSPGDEPQLAKTLDFMLDHYGEFNPSYLSELAVGQFGADAVCSQLSAFYKTAFLC